LALGAHGPRPVGFVCGCVLGKDCGLLGCFIGRGEREAARMAYLGEGQRRDIVGTRGGGIDRNGTKCLTELRFTVLKRVVLVGFGLILVHG